MCSSEYLRVNSSKVVSEVIDGEAVLVNVENGSYYSIDKVGAHIWSLIEHGTTVNQIIDVITGRYEGSLGEIASGVNQLVAQLGQEGLIISDETQEENGDDSSLIGSPNPFATDGHTGKLRFEEPTLQIYSDMQDLLLLDPIHDVDETGWPSLNADSV
jgi:hypothetical protein